MTLRSADAAVAAQLALDIYGLTASATPLPGERDQNFLLVTDSDQRFVLKVADLAEDRGFLEAQNAALDHVSGLRLCPRVVPSGNGEEIVYGPGGRFLRLLTWVPGRALGLIERKSDLLLEDVGRRIGELSGAMSTFDHPAIHREFYWDLAQAAQVVWQHESRIPDPALRGLVQRIAGHVQSRDGRMLPRVRRSAVHGDLNDFNLLVEGNDEDARVSGVIDFGDMVHSYAVAEPAIAIAYAMLDHEDPMAAATAIVRGCHAVRPFSEEELSVLFGLVQLRLCASVAIAAHQQPQRPSDDYLSISQGPIRRTLPVLAGIHPDVAEERFRQACGLDPLRPSSRVPASTTLSRRKALIGRNQSIAYREPVKVVRGWMQYLFDDTGRRYLDAYNNVPHVGHAHPHITDTIAQQMRGVNTNTRYLHDNIWQLAERLTATLPYPLRVCIFVNSGSEANELALRLARAHTGHRDLIVLEGGYHGNTTTLIDISPYKFGGPGGQGPPDWVHVAPIPDQYRGMPGSSLAEAADGFANAVGALVDRVASRGLAGFIAETCPSVGGQIVPPAGYFGRVYAHIRAAGGVCIADEVQTALGRMGSHFYAFQAHGVVPDIVVLGKPFGNGYPLAAVVTTDAIAASFDNGMEFFSTFGGSTVSCAAGLAVLEVLEREDLQAHAHRVGNRLLGSLRALMDRYEIVGDVRGSGLFLGVELVKNRSTLEPAAAEADAIVNAMRDEGILMGTEGRFHNVLKIRPPMPFNDDDADVLVQTLAHVLARQ
ncbi:MAG: aminotransferase class III-fold pyridoxal phosphate-dependent enzyme [Vicinamibacterales bacterium]